MFLILLQHHYYRLYWRVIQNINGELLILKVIEMSLGEVIIRWSVCDMHIILDESLMTIIDVLIII